MSMAIRTRSGDTVGEEVASLYRQLAALARNGVLRPGADDGYADGDDSVWRRIDWPAMTRTEEIDGRDVNVVDTGGSGPPILWVHGLSGAWQNWLLNIPQFMDRYRCVAPDLPGFGASPMPREKISITGYARTLDELCDRLGIENPVVVGNSMGGFAAADLALSFPTRVDRLVLVSAAGLSIEYQQREPLLTGARLFAAFSARTGARREPVVRRPRARRLFLQAVVRYPERLSPELTWELVQGADSPGFIPALEALMDYSYRDRLERIEVPTLIVWGRNDILVPVGDAARYERLIGDNARAVVFDDTGHVPMLERPRRFNALLEEFLAGEEPTAQPGVATVSG
jgi:pimeloyl-ACP methyl ester carboxylesterase